MYQNGVFILAAVRPQDLVLCYLPLLQRLHITVSLPDIQLCQRSGRMCKARCLFLSLCIGCLRSVQTQTVFYIYVIQ
jgi:hypothetical protein